MVGISRSPKPTHCCFHRYLKPGALARFRDSKISAARSLRPKSPTPSLLDSDLQTFLPSAVDDHQLPFLWAKLYGPQSLNRKKLTAARSVLFAGSDPVLEPTSVDVGMSRSDSSGSGSLIGALNSDAGVAAH